MTIKYQAVNICVCGVQKEEDVNEQEFKQEYNEKMMVFLKKNH